MRLFQIRGRKYIDTRAGFDLLAHETRGAELRRIHLVGLLRKMLQKIRHCSAEAASPHYLQRIRPCGCKEGQNGREKTNHLPGHKILQSRDRLQSQIA
jgi:hypothetical protein